MPVLSGKSRLEHGDNDEERSNEIDSQTTQLLQKATAIVEAYLAQRCIEIDLNPLTYFSTKHQDWPELTEVFIYVI